MPRHLNLGTIAEKLQDCVMTGMPRKQRLSEEMGTTGLNKHHLGEILIN